MIVLGVLVAVLLMVPLMMRAMRRRERRGWQGIDWTRGMSDASKHVLAGVRLQREQAYAQAVEELDHALTLEPDRVDALLARAVARHRLGRLDESLADYDRAIALGGATSEALNNRGCLRKDRGEIAPAIADLEEAIRIAPDYAIAHVSFAEALTSRGDWDAALAALRRGVELDAEWRAHARTGEAFAALREAKPEADLFA